MLRPDLTEKLFNTLMQLKKLVSQQADKSYEERATTMLQFSALKCLKDQSKVSVSDLAVFLHLSKSSATQLSERLVKMNLVKRIIDKKDKRVIRLTLTPKGVDGLIDLKKKIKEKMNRIFSKIPDKDLQELIRIHTNLIETLKKEQI